VDGLTREETCAKYQRKILFLARRMASRIPAGIGITCEDLASYGALGLLEAFDNFDEEKSIRFGTYAEYRIRGAMLDSLRASDTMSRRRRTLANRIQDAAHQLTMELGRAPNPEEVADQLEMDLETYWDALDRTSQVSMVSMDERWGDDEEGLSIAETRMPASGTDVLELLSQQNLRDELQRSIHALPERTRQCVLLYYGRNLTLAEIAKVFDLTPSRISQILSGARKRLRKTLLANSELEWREAL